jgi:hypothetical protein
MTASMTRVLACFFPRERREVKRWAFGGGQVKGRCGDRTELQSTGREDENNLGSVEELTQRIG